MSTITLKEPLPGEVAAVGLSRRVGLGARRVASNFVLRRLLLALFKIWVVITLTFFIIRLMPTNPIDAYINELITQYSISYEDARAQASALLSIDLEAPVLEQYFQYMVNLLRGDMGFSYRSRGTPVNSIIAEFLPWTLFSVGVSLFLSFTLGIVLGMVMAYRRESVLDHALSAFASVLSAIPSYLLGMILLVLLGVQWRLIPITAMRGASTPGIEPGFTLTFIKDIFFHAFLLILTYVLATIGGWMLTMKSSTIGTLGEDYVTVARARGLPERRIMTAYVGRNAALPLVTQLAISIGFVVGGAALLESIFVYKGIGKLLIDSINNRDYPVMQGVFLIITFTVIMANFLADFLYSRLDPRIRR